MIFKGIETTKGAIFIKEFAEKHNLQFKTAQILIQRGIDTDEKFEKWTNPTLNDLRDPFLLLNMKECHDRIQKAIDKNESILLFGDYDVDGISAVAILHKFFCDKVTNLNYFLPNRYEDGYGLTMDTAKKVLEKFKPDLIISVDCGIASISEVDYIKQCGVDIIITDHHEMQEKLPNTIVVDPKIPNQEYGFSGLCGAGVALKVVETFVERNNLFPYLPIAAIATISDIVPLLDENRTIIKLGLKLQQELPKGIQMLLHNLKIDNITSQSVSFKIAPKLNASGRMGDAYPSLLLYISNDEKVLKDSIKKVGELNAKRQKLSQEIYDECLKTIKEQKLYHQKAIILKNNKWDSGLLGIACARLVDEFYRPVFLFSDEDGILKGSVRSIDAINIHNVLSNCKDYLETFGGHSMAAGLSLKVDFFEEFKEQIFEYLNTQTDAKMFRTIKTYDVAIKPEEFTLELAKELEILEPVGCENSNPLFLITYDDCYVSKMQNFDSHLNISIGQNVKLVAFNQAEYFDSYLYAETKQTIFEIQTSEFKGKTYLKGIVKKTLFLGYGKNLQDISSGRLLKQYKSGKKYEKYIDFFDISQTKGLLSKLFETPTGTCVVIYNYKTYQTFKNLLSDFNLNYYVGRSYSKFEENCVVFGLDDIKFVNMYKNIVFLDCLQKTDFLNDFFGQVFAIKNVKINIPCLDFSRQCFGQIYNAIKEVLKTRAEFSSDLELYFEAKKQSPNILKISYAKFISSLYTFIDLNIIQNKSTEILDLEINDAQKTVLDNSAYYNYLRLISNIQS